MFSCLLCFHPSHTHSIMVNCPYIYTLLEEDEKRKLGVRKERGDLFLFDPCVAYDIDSFLTEFSGSIIYDPVDVVFYDKRKTLTTFGFVARHKLKSLTVQGETQVCCSGTPNLVTGCIIIKLKIVAPTRAVEQNLCCCLVPKVRNMN